MKVILAISCCIFFHTISSGQGRYYDFPGSAVRNREFRKTRLAYDASKKTTNAYNLTLPELISTELLKTTFRVNLNGNHTINYLNYKNLCSSYLNPFEKKACNNKLNYLIEAHQQVLLLMQSSTSNKIDTGVKELIEEKYTHITNTILNELEMMKLESEKNWANMLLKN